MPDKFDYLTNRLVEKMKMSQTPVPGFIVGLSGTDSVLAFLLLHAACRVMGMPERVYGIHYVNAARRKPTWFERGVIPWLKERCPEAAVAVESPLGGYHDPQRWADLHLRALNEVEVDTAGKAAVHPLEEGRNWWVVGTINATEFALGTYSMMAATASIQPLRKVWKSNVMAMCKVQDVPKIAMDNARIPDCLCGRDELAAANIELIDQIIKLELNVDEHPPELLTKLIAYVHDQKRANDFKTRTPYLL